MCEGTRGWWRLGRGSGRSQGRPGAPLARSAWLAPWARAPDAHAAAAQAESYNKLIYRNTPVAAGVRLPLLSRGRDGAAARASGERRVGTTRGGQVCDLEEQAGEHSSRRMAEPLSGLLPGGGCGGDTRQHVSRQVKTGANSSSERVGNSKPRAGDETERNSRRGPPLRFLAHASTSIE